MRTLVRTVVEKIPTLAESYRLVRDYVRFKRSSFLCTAHGIALAGNSKMAQGAYEVEETSILLRQMQEADVFIDVGANIGYYSCLARSKDLYVVAVEPSTENLRYLYSNLLENGFDDVEVFPVGLGHQTALMRLFGTGGSASLIEGWSNASRVHSNVIPITTFDLLLENRFHEKRILVKIDVEGGELAVLRGAEHFVNRELKPTWFVEIYLIHERMKEASSSFIETFQFFWDHGYSAHVASEAAGEVRQRDVLDWIANRRTPHDTANYIFKTTG